MPKKELENGLVVMSYRHNPDSILPEGMESYSVLDMMTFHLEQLETMMAELLDMEFPDNTFKAQADFPLDKITTKNAPQGSQDIGEVMKSVSELLDMTGWGPQGAIICGVAYHHILEGAIKRIKGVVN
jgi:hypothetical protein